MTTNLYDRFWHFPDSKQIITKKQLTEFLDDNIINGEYRLIFKGEIYNIKYKSKGLGRYQIWLIPTLEEEAWVKSQVSKKGGELC